MVCVDGKGRDLEHGSLNGDEWFCIDRKRERTLEWGRQWWGHKSG